MYIKVLGGRQAEFYHFYLDDQEVWDVQTIQANLSGLA